MGFRDPKVEKHVDDQGCHRHPQGCAQSKAKSHDHTLLWGVGECSVIGTAFANWRSIRRLHMEGTNKSNLKERPKERTKFENCEELDIDFVKEPFVELGESHGDDVPCGVQ